MICQAANQRNEHVPNSLAQGVESAEQTAREAYDALTQLKPPPEIAHLHAEMLRLTRDLLEGFSPLVEAAKTGMTVFAQASAERAERNTRLGKEVEEVWKKLGVPDCYEPYD